MSCGSDFDRVLVINLISTLSNVVLTRFYLYKDIIPDESLEINAS